MVEVNPAAGQLKILRYIAVHDVGTIINPKSLRGQIAGGIAQGIGMALYEEMPLRHERSAPHRQLHGLPVADGQRGAGLRDRPRGDALAPLGVSIGELPMTPQRLADLVEAARARG